MERLNSNPKRSGKSQSEPVGKENSVASDPSSPSFEGVKESENQVPQQQSMRVPEQPSLSITRAGKSLGISQLFLLVILYVAKKVYEIET